MTTHYVRTTYDDLWVSRFTELQRKNNCGYWFTVTSHGMAHTAFDTIDGLHRWASERGITIERELMEPGHCRITGQYRKASHLCGDPSEVEQMEGLHTRDLSNGDYVVAVITTDTDGVRTVHTLNPNVRGRKTFNHRESDWIMGGLQTGGKDGKRRLFSGVYPGGIVYSDRWREYAGDYKRLAFLPYDTLALAFESTCPTELRAMIVDDAQKIIDMRGQRFPTSASGQSVILGTTV